MVAADFEAGGERATVQGNGAEPRRAAAFAIYVLADGDGPSTDLLTCLQNESMRYEVIYDSDIAPGPAADADIILIDLIDVDRKTVEVLSKRAATANIPTIAAISWDHLNAPGLRLTADDVIVVPWRLGELAFRTRRQMDKKQPPDEVGVIRAGDLVINTNRYDVFLSGKPVLLTFKEYELLKLLAGNPGRVYSREALLEQVWGYQYFGGTRTVDVHVRRLRSKIEDASHTFIDTVWNVGYRFHAS
ncbi:MAG: response regulator transcription factor [Dehalococcoidia bacterium]